MTSVGNVSTESTAERVDQFVETAKELRDQLRAHASDSDSRRSLDVGDVQAMYKGGLMSLWAPAAFGGEELPFRAVVDVTRALGNGDVGAGWVAGVSNAATFLIALFPDEARREVWKDGPIRSAGVLSPAGKSDITDGGVRLTGRWPYCSGVQFADWVAVLAPVNGTLGPEAEIGIMLLRRDEIEIEDTWFVTGMRATGSATVVLNDQFVPDHRILRMSQYRPDSYEGMYRAAIFSALSVCLVGPVVGEAEYALEIVLEKAPTRSINTTTYWAQTDSATFQAQVAEAAQLIQAARLTAENAADEMDAIARSGRLPNDREQTQNRADCAFAVRKCWEALDLLTSAHGTSTFAQSNPLERIWRNAGVTSRHAGLAVRVADELLGLSLLGLDTKKVGLTL
ncbi:MAG: acyl-CoA dehydrogenase family protein [Actinomycetota bacterium]